MAHMELSNVADGSVTESFLKPEKEQVEGTTEDLKKSNSRFKVARVDFVDETGDRDEKKIAPPKDIELDRVVLDHVDRGPESPSATFSVSGDTFSHSYDTSNNKTCAMMNTHEALPCLDHYRNIFSATGELKSRPTLAQLHEEMVSICCDVFESNEEIKISSGLY